MADVRGFPPITGHDPSILILGSMPGRESLEQQRYYAHPRNAFWPIMRRLFGLDGTDYGQNTRELAARGVAVWDVLQACFRAGSLDSNIDDRSIVTNDFDSFFATHPGIARVCFNGAKAESVYRRRVLPRLEPRWAELPLLRLPSTSPAHAGMSLEQKADAWKAVLD